MSTASYDAFISYSRADVAAAAQIHAELEKIHGLRIFRDVTDIGGGSRWIPALTAALAASRTVVFLISRNSVGSKWVEDELGYALTLANSREGGPLLIPVLLDDSRPPGFLVTRNVVDFRTSASFADRVLHLANAIRGAAPAPAAPLPVPGELAFLAFFPEGLIDSLYRELIRRRGADAIAARGEAAGLIRRTEARGVEFLGLDAARVAGARASLENPEDEARAILELLDACFASGDPFDDDLSLGRGRALLLRDLLGLAVVAGSSADIERVEHLRQLARSLLPRIVNEGEIRIALEISKDVLELAFSPAPLDFLIHGHLLLQLDQPLLALGMFDLFRGAGVPFRDVDLSDRQRMNFTLDWAKAVKDAGQSRRLHDQVVNALGVMIDRADELLEQGTDGETRRLKADLLNSRATQLAVFGTEQDWIGVEADLHEVLRTYRQLEEFDRLLDAQANLVSHVLDRSAAAPAEIGALLAETDRLEHDVSPHVSARSFFFLYQKARLMRRLERPAEGREMFAAAGRVARSTQPHRAALAQWQILRMRRQQDDISEEEYVDGLTTCARELERAAAGDAWSAHALSQLLIDLARVQINRKALQPACQAIARALELRVAGLRPNDTPAGRQRKALQEIVTLLGKIAPTHPLDECLGAPLIERLKPFTGRPPYLELRLVDLEGWLSAKPPEDR